MRLRSNRLSALLPTVALLVCSAVTGCLSRVALAPGYVEPVPSEPHAIVKVRLTYHSTPGTELEQGVLLDGRRARVGGMGEITQGSQVRALRVRPRPVLWDLSSRFHHTQSYSATENYTERQPYQEQESYTVSRPYSCGGYSSGSYTSRTCYRNETQYRSVTKYRSVSKQRRVTRQREVDDAYCRAGLQHTPKPGAMYILQYDYYEHGSCTIQCLEQVPGSNGEFSLQPCSSGAPDQAR